MSNVVTIVKFSNLSTPLNDTVGVDIITERNSWFLLTFILLPGLVYRTGTRGVDFVEVRLL